MTDRLGQLAVEVRTQIALGDIAGEEAYERALMANKNLGLMFWELYVQVSPEEFWKIMKELGAKQKHVRACMAAVKP
jgi:hypothetical protein